MRRGRRKVEIRCERMYRNPSHWGLALLLASLLSHCGKLASLSPAQPSPRTRMAVDLGRTLNVTVFDDDADFHCHNTLKHTVMRRKVAASSSPKSNISPERTYQVVSLVDQEMINRSSDQNELELNGDLLAIESSDRSRLFLPQHQHVRSPPYALHEQSIKTNHSVSSEPLQNIQTEQDDRQLLKLHRTPELVPIYLRHPLPPSVTRPRIIAFEHPASLRKQAESSGQNQHPVNSEPDSSGASFALIPSWPKIYIAQRERLAITKHNDSHQSELEPRVPSIYPNWSTRHLSSEQTRTESPAAEQQQQQQHSEYEQKGIESSKKSVNLDSTSPRVNLTASEVEYEETSNNREGPAHRQKSHDTTEWAKLLRQAAKSDVMESIMLTNRSIVSLLCDTDNMIVRFKFRQPFHGLVDTNLDPNEQCRLFGNGSQFYEMRIDLYGCGTRQEMPRLFMNNLQIRYQNPFPSIRSRLSLLEQQQQAANNDQLKDVEELKTIICSYPIQARAQVPARAQLDLTSNDLNRTDGSSSDFFKQGPASNLSDRIIEVPRHDTQDSARLLYYEPVLLISGLLLLAIACTLALITSAYLVRRRQQKILSRSDSTIRGSSQLSPDGLSGAPMRIYNRSPAQMANQRSLVAPPLLALSKEESLGVRPSIKQYPSSKTNGLRKKQQQSAHRKSVAMKKDDGRFWRRPALQQQPNQSPTTTDTADSLDSHTGRAQSSVTTIDIPYVNQSTEILAKRKLDRDEAVQTDLEGLKEVSSFSKYKQIKKEEKIIETSYQGERREANTAAKTDRASCMDQKRQSPIPFGSFRSKLTSPREFKRLKNIKRLFEQSCEDHDSNSSLSKLKMRICRTLSEPERHQLIEMLTTDEVFRSNILDSIDRQTFSRKLRENPNYSGRFSTVAWELLEEILLQIDIDGLLCGGQKFDGERENELMFASAKVPPTKCEPPTRTHLFLNHSKRPDDLDIHRAHNKDEPLRKPKSRQQNRFELVDSSDNSIDAIRVSQSNSTSTRRVPSGTLLNMDSVTNIRTRTNTTAYSSSFQQTTRYEQAPHAADDSLPYMDELSQNSIGNQSWSSLEREQRKQGPR